MFITKVIIKIAQHNYEDKFMKTFNTQVLPLNISGKGIVFPIKLNHLDDMPKINEEIMINNNRYEVLGVELSRTGCPAIISKDIGIIVKEKN